MVASLCYIGINNNDNNRGQNMTTDQFIKITRQDAQALQGMSKSAILILIEMRFFAGANGEAFPSKDTLSKNTGLSIGSIKRGLKELKQAGAINLKSARRTSTNVYNVEGAISDPRGIISKPLEDQKRSVGGSVLSFRGIENDPLSRNSKEIKEIDPIKQRIDTPDDDNNQVNFLAKNDDNDLQSFETDMRDLWLGELWAKHSMEQGWKSEDVQKDFDTIKKGLSLLQIAKSVRKLDSFISERKINGMYMGKGWVRKVRDRWAAKESDTPITAYDRNKMRLSTIAIQNEVVEEIRQDAKKAQESADRAQAVAMADKSNAGALWARFRANNDDYEACAGAVLAWVQSGGLTDELKKEIENDPQLDDFNALIHCANYQ
tara:strand:- start:823 stop:1950 length:1128 start_codon:yes stop_codon:yes gene_type:complete